MTTALSAEQLQAFRLRMRVALLEDLLLQQIAAPGGALATDASIQASVRALSLSLPKAAELGGKVYLSDPAVQAIPVHQRALLADELLECVQDLQAMLQRAISRKSG